MLKLRRHVRVNSVVEVVLREHLRLGGHAHLRELLSSLRHVAVALEERARADLRIFPTTGLTAAVLALDKGGEAPALNATRDRMAPGST
ncbi:MAG TPA: hypothetical protein VFX28_15675, partial [Methylomirabilota bacterium]|nr:hypothetical protein [Methylomirabilota bacterium]